MISIAAGIDYADGVSFTSANAAACQGLMTSSAPAPGRQRRSRGTPRTRGRRCQTGRAGHGEQRRSASPGCRGSVTVGFRLGAAHRVHVPLPGHALQLADAAVIEVRREPAAMSRTVEETDTSPGRPQP